MGMLRTGCSRLHCVVMTAGLFAIGLILYLPQVVQRLPPSGTYPQHGDMSNNPAINIDGHKVAELSRTKVYQNSISIHVKKNNIHVLNIPEDEKRTEDNKRVGEIQKRIFGKYRYSGHSLNAQDLDYVYEPKMNPCSAETYLFVAVCSSLDRFNLRQSIRNTWGKSSSHIAVMFFIGQPRENQDFLQRHLKEEMMAYGDVVQQSYFDEHNTLSVKTIGALKWSVQRCPTVKYFMKTDDDLFLNIPLLLKTLRDFEPHSRLMLGHVIHGAKPIMDRSAKWFTSHAVYQSATFPDYLSGTAYIVTRDLVRPLYHLALRTKTFWLEDVYITGILRLGLGDVGLVHDSRFSYIRRQLDPCLFKRVITGHELTAEELTQIWSAIQNTSLVCDKTL